MEILTVLIYIVGVVISWVIFYYVVKAAIRNGIKEAKIDEGNIKLNTNNYKTSTPTLQANKEQIKLQEKYERGEISLDVYQSEWNKLS
ncbi:MAG: hypothetical protein ACOYVG_11745 [Bacteroidota bacterium]